MGEHAGADGNAVTSRDVAWHRVTSPGIAWHRVVLLGAFEAWLD